MAARRKPIEKAIEQPIPEQKNEPEHIEVKQDDIDLRYHLMIPVKMYERMHNIGNDAYWLRIIENHIEIMMTRYHQ